MLLLTCAVILLSVLIYKRFQHLATFKRLGIPGPRPNFIFGNLIDIAANGVNGSCQKWTKKYGPIVGFFIGGRPQLLITDFELIRHVLIKDFNLFSNRSQLIPGGIHPVSQLQTMLIWARDNTWRQLRASMSPSFTSYKLNAMEPLMITTIDKFVSDFDNKAKSGQEFNVKPFLNEFTFSTAAKCIFGLDFSLNQLLDDVKSVVAATQPRLEKSMLAMAMVLFPSLAFIAYPLRVLWETLRLHMLWSPEGVCYNMARQIVKVRRETESTSADFIQLLMNAKRIRSTVELDLEMSSDETKPKQNESSKDDHNENLSEEEIISNSMLFLLASYETTSATLQFIMSNLINNPDIQEKLRNDLLKAVGERKKNIEWSTVSRVPLLNHIIKETLRMYPPGSPFMTRVANEDYKYKDIVIPKGTTVFIGVSSIHNDPKLWPEPKQFRPERFENEIDKLTYLAFGSGPRNCIGMRFAYMEIQLALANLILKYRFEPGPSTEKKIETMETFTTLVPKNGVFCKLTKLDE